MLGPALLGSGGLVIRSCGLVLALYPAVSAEVVEHQGRDEDAMDCE
jgi:hypothetical protein